MHVHSIVIATYPVSFNTIIGSIDIVIYIVSAGDHKSQVYSDTEANSTTYDNYH